MKTLFAQSQGPKAQAEAWQQMDATSLFLNVILGSVGMGYVVYGRKQKHGIALLSGVILCGIPWAISNNFLLAVVGVGAAILPFLISY